MARMMSLKKDANDENAVSWGRFKHMGACVASEFYQTVPYFFTRESAQINLVGQYRGASAFLIASGPSFGELNKDLLRKPGVWSISLNNAVKSFRGNAACIVDDPSRFTLSLWLDPSITKFVPKSAFEKPLWDNRLIERPNGDDQRWEPYRDAGRDIKVGDCPNVIGYRRNEKFVAERYLYEDTINWGCHKDFGGGRSVLLATLRVLFLLGFRKVYLLGVDFHMSSEKKYHFDEERTKSAINGNMDTYSKMKKWFEELQPVFLAENFKVFNCNEKSELKAFPYMPFNEAIDEAATFKIGNPEKERVRGMYCKHDDKLAAWQRGEDPPPDMPEKKRPIIIGKGQTVEMPLNSPNAPKEIRLANTNIRVIPSPVPDK